MRPTDIQVNELEAAELLGALIRNRCVNTAERGSGGERRSVETLCDYLDGSGLELERFEAAPSRESLVVRLPGRDPAAPRLSFVSHTDVVPVNSEGWRHDPFGGELIDGEVWGRGAVDMLHSVATQAVALRHLAANRVRPDGDVILVAAADEESRGTYGVQHLVESHWETVACDFALGEVGGYHTQSRAGHTVAVSVAEKGYAWWRLIVRGTPGHGGMPHAADNALIKAADVIRRIAAIEPAPRLDDLWASRVRALGLEPELEEVLLDPDRLDAVLDTLDEATARAHLHGCSHTTLSPNVVHGGQNSNMIPDRVAVTLDSRLLPGDTPASLREQIGEALGDLADDVEIEVIGEGVANRSSTETPLWPLLRQAVQAELPQVDLSPGLLVGFSDCRFYRERGIPAYGVGLLNPELTPQQFASRFHGHDERIDLESLRLTTRLWLNVVDGLTRESGSGVTAAAGRAGREADAGLGSGG
ncbi:MAG TPA: M20/M25/M40 family metallo-hydrolase [Thermoleophilaceae bacterium]|jgi:acetylornithine deacetylase/succinyl-diaminopimelate desuccinylase-like protein